MSEALPIEQDVESLNTFQDDGGVARDATAVEACTSQASQVSELPNLGPIASLAPSSLFRGSLLASPSRSHMGAARDRKSSFAVSGEDVLKTLPDSSLMVATDVSELDFEVLINEARDLDNLKLSVLPYDPAQTSQESRLLTPNKQSELDTESSTPLPRLSKTSQEARSQSQALTGSENAEDGLGIPINGIRGIRGPPLSLPRDTFSMQGEEFGSASANEDELDFEILINSIQTRSLQTNLRGFISRMHQPSERISSPATKCDMPQFDHELRAQSPPMNKTSYTCKSQEAQAGNNSTSTMLDDQRPSVESTPLPGQRQQHHCPPGKRPSAECLQMLLAAEQDKVRKLYALIPIDSPASVFRSSIATLDVEIARCEAYISERIEQDIKLQRNIRNLKTVAEIRGLKDT